MELKKYQPCWPLGRGFDPVRMPGLDPDAYSHLAHGRRVSQPGIVKMSAVPPVPQ